MLFVEWVYWSNMKQTNIPEQHCTMNQLRSFMQWYRIAYLMILGSLLLGICATIPVVMNWIAVRNNRIALQNQLASFEEAVDKKRTCKTKEQALQKMLAKIEKISNHTHWLYDYIIAVRDILADDGLIESLMVGKKTFQITCYAYDIVRLMACIERLTHSSLFSHIVVQSITQQSQQKQRYIATITGSIV